MGIVVVGIVLFGIGWHFQQPANHLTSGPDVVVRNDTSTTVREYFNLPSHDPLVDSINEQPTIIRPGATAQWSGEYAMLRGSDGKVLGCWPTTPDTGRVALLVSHVAPRYCNI